VEPIFEELIAGAVTMTVIGIIIAFFYWAVTGNNPWPYIVLSEIAAFGFGVVIIALCGPKRQR